MSNFQLFNYSQLCGLAARFLACDTLSSSEEITQVRDNLPESITDNVVLPARYSPRQEMLNILLACVRVEDGLKTLLDTIRYIESDTEPFRQLETYFNKLQSAVTVSPEAATEPPGDGWEEFLAELIEDMRVRKGRLKQLGTTGGELDYCTRQLEIWERELNTTVIPLETPTPGPTSIDLRPFIISGSTIEPWHKVVLEAIKEQQGEPQTFPLEEMAQIPGSLDLCKTYLSNSTHYIGLYTPQRGTKLPGLSQTVPEVQFEWATEKGKPLATFVMEWGAPQAMQLMQSQDMAATSEQMTFITRISSYPVNKLFKDPADLREKVLQQIQLWKKGSPLQQTQVEEPIPAAKVVAPDITNLFDTLGWADNLQEFNLLLQHLSGLLEYKGMACFVVHGPRFYGQGRLVERLYKAILQDNSGASQLSKGLRLADLKSPVVSKNLTGVLKALQAPATLEEWAEVISREVRQQDVVVHLASTHLYESGLPGLVDELWQGLVKLLATRSDFGPNRFFLIVSQEKPLDDATLALFQKADPTQLQAFDVNRPISLKLLTQFEAVDLRSWLRKYRLVSLTPEQEENLISQVIEDAEGKPEIVFEELQKALNSLKS